MSTTIGRYQIERKLSEGGMAEVFVARGSFDKQVVLKCVSPEHAADPRFTAMLIAEARIAAALDHAHIVQVLDLVEHQARHFIVMELLDGQTVRAMLKRAAQLKVRMSPAVACRLIANLLAGLAYAHDRRGADGSPLGLVHRDVSPANVVVTWSGGVKLIDFGIAKATEQLGEELTRAGQRKGKAAYMSPEQVHGQALDRRSDIFSTGIVLWELLTNRRLFQRASDLQSMLAITREQAMPPSTLVPGLPPELDAIVLRALERDPDARYSDASIMRRDLEALMHAQHWDSSPLAIERQLAALFTDTFEDSPTVSRFTAAATPRQPPLPELPAPSLTTSDEQQALVAPTATAPEVVPSASAPVEQDPDALDAFETVTEVRPPTQIEVRPPVQLEAQPTGAPLVTVDDSWSTDQMSAAPAPVRKHRVRAMVAALACFAIGAAGCAAAVHYFG